MLTMVICLGILYVSEAMVAIDSWAYPTSKYTAILVRGSGSGSALATVSGTGGETRVRRLTLRPVNLR